MTTQQQPLSASQDSGGRVLDVCIITGLSGAGKSTALQVFEDMGYFRIDGLPNSLVLDMVRMMQRDSMRHFSGIVLGMDVRRSGMAEDISHTMQELKKCGVHTHIFFLEASDTVLMRRYATTRRPHPLEREGMGLEAALEAERKRLAPLRSMADVVLDTTRYSIHQLRQAIQKRWSSGKEQLRMLKVNIVSFGFKYGVPKEADMVFDLRFLPNPYFVEELRPLCGKDVSVAEYVFADASAVAFRQHLVEFLLFTLPLVEAEGRYRLTVAVGCTGGRHRSVAMAEYLFHRFMQAGFPVALEHRHLELG